MKNLLTENEIRKMMKYADMNTLADGFVQRVNENYMEQEDPMMEEEEEEMPPADDLEAGAEDMGAEDPPPVDEPEMEAPPAGDMDVEALVSDLADIISKHTGVDVEVEDDGAGAAEEPMEDPMAGEEEEAAMAPSPETPEAPEGGEEEEEMMEMDGDDLEEETLDEVVNLIARRVAKRILTEQ